MNSILLSLSKNFIENFGDTYYNLINEYLNKKNRSANVIKRWGEFCNYICAGKNPFNVKLILDKFITALGIKEKDQEILHFDYSSFASEKLGYTNGFYEFNGNLDISSNIVDDNTPFKSFVFNLNYLLNFSTIKNEIFLPLYQRNYSWNERLIDILFGDIEVLIEEENKKHFLGSITFSQINNTLNIVDGQQRTMTLILFSYALYKMILHYNVNNEDKILIPEVFADMFKNKKHWMNLRNYEESESYQYLKLLFSSDIKQIRKVFVPDVEKEFKSKIKNNLDHIWSILNSKIGFNKEKIEKLTKVFLENLYFNIMFVQSKYEDKIFEKMNLLSQRLNNIDLINSLIYKLWDPFNYPGCVNSFKKNISEHFYKVKNDETIEDDKKIEIFANFINYKHNLNCDSERNNEYKAYYILKNFIETKHKEFNGDFQKFLDVISKDLWIFKFILTENANELEKLFDSQKMVFAKEISEANKHMLISIFPFMRLTKVADTTVLFLIVYSILQKFNIISFNEFASKDDNLTNFNKAIRWLFEIERFRWIWKTSYFEGQSIRDIVKRWADKIQHRDDSDNIENIEDLRKELYKWINPQSTIKEIISTFDKDIENRLSEPSKRITNSNKDYVMLIRRVECFLMNDFNNFPNWSYLKDNSELTKFLNLFSKNSSWEHFYSKKIQEDSKDPEIEQAQKDSNLIDSIGNGFVLNMQANSKGKNNPPAEKYEKLYKYTEKSMMSFTGVKFTIKEVKDKYLDKLLELIENQYKNYDEKIEILKIEKEWTKEKIENRNKAIIALIQDIYSLKKSDK
ncbi:DUF262 domain-containing protein [Mycoplasmopsis pullorum]|uniref:GmrSD restriction endonucleases N-terminal domain-containing protein n=1 Tax=Mycoplasmopsis pullorum TaxID=48003 RepID=A0A1L4FRA3_9BACT|nr:DUF262 domain-containing protein [Mycoplasmopsis pullorum]APJ38134.1 hypothetical protein BLA55_00290 [Mycoplasmopsis pullorum]